MAKDKKAKKARKGDEVDAPKVKKAKAKKQDGDGGVRAHPLEALSKLADVRSKERASRSGSAMPIAAITTPPTARRRVWTRGSWDTAGRPPMGLGATDSRPSGPSPTPVARRTSTSR